jgi:hypothetical protein
MRFAVVVGCNDRPFRRAINLKRESWGRESSVRADDDAPTSPRTEWLATELAEVLVLAGAIIFLPEPAVGVNCPDSAKLPDPSPYRRPDYQDAFGRCEFSSSLIENQKELDWNAARVLEQIRAIEIVHWHSALGHFPNQAWNLVGVKLIGSYSNVGCLRQFKPLFVVRPSDKIFEPFLCERDLPRIRLCNHESLVIRTERGGRVMVSAGFAGDADQRKEQMVFFHL